MSKSTQAEQVRKVQGPAGSFMICDFHHPLSDHAGHKPSQRLAGAFLVLLLHVLFLFLLVGQTTRSLQGSSKAFGGSSVEVSLYSPLPSKPASPLPEERSHNAVPKQKDAKSKAIAPKDMFGTTVVLPRQNPAGGETGSQNPAPATDIGALSASTPIDYQKQLLARIEAFKQYPADAGYQHPLGTVIVLFTLNRNGIVLGTWIKESSGTPALDREAISTVLRAQPLPQIPSELPDPLNIALPIRYDR